MTRTPVLCSSLAAALAMFAWSPVARAQSPPPAASAQVSTVTTFEESRPATPTFLGDTGIWYVPTAETLRAGTWSVGGDRRGTNYVQGSSNVADFAGSAAVGIGNRVEVFGAFLFDTRVNRDDAPVFSDDAREGGIAARYPGVNQSWTGNNIGDLYLGTKVNLLSEYRQAPFGLAVRGMIKLPTGDEAAGVSTGQTDVMADLIASREFARFFETAMYAGYEVRGKPDGFVAPRSSYRWGTGVAFPSRSPLRLTAEMNGDLPTSYRATLTDTSVIGDDGSLRPIESDIRNRTRATGGVTYQLPGGLFAGTGLSWNAPRYWDWQVRVGYYGRRQALARRLVSVTLPVMIAELPVVSARPLAASVFEPLPAPVLATAPTPAPLVAATPKPAPVMVPAPVTLPLLIAGPAPVVAARSYSFEDVYFDLDGFTLRAEARVALDAAAKAMLADATLNLDVEGHTCNIGTGEYNVALASRRAEAVRDYFVGRGVAVGRLHTATFGEDDPQHANAHVETQKLNRRVALVVRMQP